MIISYHGDPASPFQKRGAHPPIFSPCLLWPNGWMDQDTTWYGGRPRPRRHCVVWGPAAPKKEGHTRQSSAHVYCGQTAGCISIPFGTEVGLGPGDIVLDGDPAAPKKGHRPTIFGPCLLWPNSYMHQDTTCYGGSPWPRRHCVGWGPSSHPKRGTARNFRPMSIVTKRLDVSRCHLVRR